MATYESKKYNFTGAQLTSLAAPNMADGTVSDEEFQRLDGVTSDIQTQIDAGLGAGGGTMTGDLAFGDNVLAKFGDSNDLQIFHNTNDSIVKDVGTGNLVLGGDNVQITNAALNKNQAVFTSDGAATLYHNDNAKIATTSGGVTITGTATATTFSGSGASLTSLPAGNLTGTVADARLSTVSSSKLSGSLPAIDGSALTNLPVTPSSTVDGVGAIQLCYYDIFNSTASISRGSTTSASNLKVAPNGASMFSYQTNPGSVPTPASGTQLTSGTWLALTGTYTANVNTNSGPATRYGPGLFIRIS
tara:strand:+ start:91 stop:999 length:909 start_codon:yes stop_codon:yes gene_type:complete